MKTKTSHQMKMMKNLHQSYSDRRAQE